jgi:hypothetical protein
MGVKLGLILPKVEEARVKDNQEMGTEDTETAIGSWTERNNISQIA